MNKEDMTVLLILGLLMLFMFIACAMVLTNNAYCKEEEHKKEWNCITEKDLLGGKE